jgi:hypothetical protein
MRNLLIAVGLVGMFGSAAVAGEVVVKPPIPGVVVEHHAANEGTTTRKTAPYDNGCTTHSVTHSDSDNDSSVTHTRTDC